MAARLRRKILRDPPVPFFHPARARAAKLKPVVHDFVSINSARQPRLTLRARAGSRFGKFIIVHHENALERIRPG
jgi:hypothetical protein